MGDSEGFHLEVRFKLNSGSQERDWPVKIWGKHVLGRVSSWHAVKQRLGISEKQKGGRE